MLIFFVIEKVLSSDNNIKIYQNILGKREEIKDDSIVTKCRNLGYIWNLENAYIIIEPNKITVKFTEKNSKNFLAISHDIIFAEIENYKKFPDSLVSDKYINNSIILPVMRDDSFNKNLFTTDYTLKVFRCPYDNNEINCENIFRYFHLFEGLDIAGRVIVNSYVKQSTQFKNTLVYVYYDIKFKLL